MIVQNKLAAGFNAASLKAMFCAETGLFHLNKQEKRIAVLAALFYAGLC